MTKSCIFKDKKQLFFHDEFLLSSMNIYLYKSIRKNPFKRSCDITKW